MTNLTLGNAKKEEDPTRFEGFRNYLRSLDLRAWTVLVLMFTVLTAMMAVNAWAWTAFLPVVIAYSLSFFMEAGALGWAFATERPENSQDQQTLTTWLKWGNVIMGVLLLVANLTRSLINPAMAAGEMQTIQATGWDFFAFMLVALSALSHVGGALLFRQWDTRLINNRSIANKQKQTEYEKQVKQGILTNLDDELAQTVSVLESLEDIRKKYAHLPPEKLNTILDKALDALGEKVEIATEALVAESVEVPEVDPIVDVTIKTDEKIDEPIIPDQEQAPSPEEGEEAPPKEAPPTEPSL